MISVIIITKNEADKIARCLESVKWADEIVIIDDMSSDDTVEICRKYTDKIISHRSNGDFDNQRNIGIDNSNGEWILQMDADEVVTETLRTKIEKVLRNDNLDFSGLKFKRKNYFLGRALLRGGWHHDFLRIFRKNAGRYVGASVHELLEVKGKIGYLNADMDHYLCQNIGQFVERQNYYSSVEAERLLREYDLVSDRKIKYHLTVRPLKLFWKTYVKKRGFRDGMYGLVYCILNLYVHFLKWAKYWELSKKQDKK